MSQPNAWGAGYHIRLTDDGMRRFGGELREYTAQIVLDEPSGLLFAEDITDASGRRCGGCLGPSGYTTVRPVVPDGDTLGEAAAKLADRAARRAKLYARGEK